VRRRKCVEAYGLLSIFFVSFFVVLWSTPKYIKKFKKGDHVARDYYKEGEVYVPTMGGLAILGGILASLVLAQFLTEDIEKLLIFYFVVLVYSVFGLLDDLVNVKRTLKIVAPFFMALPIALLNKDTTFWVVFTQIEMGAIYKYVVAPLYVMVVMNLINMHSGYNGLSGGLTTITVFSAAVKVYLKYGPSELIYIMPFLGAMVAFMYYNAHPSRIFWGNIGSLGGGATLGAFLIIENLEVFGTIILIPHIINFLLYVYWTLKKIPHVKHGSIRSDGTLEVPNPLTLKWIPPYYFRMTEKRATWIQYGITTAFCVAGLVLV